MGASTRTRTEKVSLPPLKLCTHTYTYTFAQGPLRAIAGMYRGLRRSFKVLGSLGEPFAATNGILQGCPLSVILSNILTTI